MRFGHGRAAVRGRWPLHVEREYAGFGHRDRGARGKRELELAGTNGRAD
jgi:hypothetical protein